MSVILIPRFPLPKEIGKAMRTTSRKSKFPSSEGLGVGSLLASRQSGIPSQEGLGVGSSLSSRQSEFPSLEGLGVGSFLRPLPLLLLFFLLPTLLLAATPTLSVNVSRERIYLGESVLLEIKVGGDHDPAAPDLSALKHCAPELLGSQPASHYSVVIVNGQMKREGFSGRIFTYKVTPGTEGSFVMGPVTAKVGGVQVTATGPVISVTGVTKQNIVVASLSASRATVLVDEPFDITLTLRIKALAKPYQDIEPLYPADPPHIEATYLNGQEIDGLKGPDFQRLLSSLLGNPSQAGFTVNEFTSQADPFDFGQVFGQKGRLARFKLSHKKITQGGQDYWEYTLTVPYTPLTEGAYTFGPLLFKGAIPVEVKADGTASGSPIFAVGPAAMVRVIPPPEENRPDSYIGAIGSNLAVEASLDAQTCNVGDPLKLTLALSGAIQMRNISPPKLSLQPALLERFEIYDESVQTGKQNGQRQYEYTLRPRRAGSFELPAVEVSYYDVSLRQYQTVRSLPIPLKVRQATEITASQVIGGSTNGGPRLKHEMELAMRPAGIRVGLAGAEPASLVGKPWRVACIAGVGPVVFVLVLAGYLIRRTGPSFKRAQRQRQAFARARKAIRALDTVLIPSSEGLGVGSLPPRKSEIPSLEGCPEGGVGSSPRAASSNEHRDICTILRHYLADRFDVQAESFTPAEAEALLIQKGLPYDLAKRFSGMMQRHFDASFGSHQIEGDKTDLLAMLTEIEGYRQERPGTRMARGAIVALLIGGAHAAVASTPGERSFIWMESLTGLSTAQTPQDFLGVAGTCQKLVDLGVRNTDLFYNQGTALLMAGKPADAVAVLLRAERYGGNAPDIARNLAIAEGRKQGLKTPVTSWLRWVLFWHYGLDCATRVTITAVAFSLLWLAGALRLSGLRRTGAVLMVGAAVLMVLFGSSVLATFQQESQVVRPVSLTDRLT